MSGKYIMEHNVWILVFGILYSIQSMCDAKIIRTVQVPHNVPIGYEISKLFLKEAPHVIESCDGDLNNVFNVYENGAVVTKNKLNNLVGLSQVLVVKNEINDKVLESLHINIVQSQHHLVFQQSKYIGTIKENERKGEQVKIIGHLIVLDCKNVTYSLLNGSESFEVRTVSFGSTHDNVITSLKSFNREIQDLYMITLEGKCSSGKSASSVLEIHILDKNDIIPKFKSAVQSVETLPDQSWGKITTVTAYDGDQNEHITYTLKGSEELYIDQDTGDVYSEKDYLYPGSYSATTFATDSVGHVSEPLSLHVEVQSNTLTFVPKYSKGHHLTKRATVTIQMPYDIVENSSVSKSLFSVASVKPRPLAERYKQISASLDIFEEPDYNGQVFLKPGYSLDYEDVNHRQIVLIYNRTNMNTPEGKIPSSPPSFNMILTDIFNVQPPIPYQNTVDRFHQFWLT